MESAPGGELSYFLDQGLFLFWKGGESITTLDCLTVLHPAEMCEDSKHCSGLGETGIFWAFVLVPIDCQFGSLPNAGWGPSTQCCCIGKHGFC